jgi:hypothetical protein
MIEILVGPDEGEIREILEHEGFDARRVSIFYRGHGPEPLGSLFEFIFNLPWTVVIAAPLYLFFKSFMTKAGEDAYAGLKQVLDSVLSAKRRQPLHRRRGRLVLKDRGSDILVELRDDVSDEALRSLLSPSFLERLRSVESEKQRRWFPKSTIFVWNKESGEWVAQKTASPPEIR